VKADELIEKVQHLHTDLMKHKKKLSSTNHIRESNARFTDIGMPKKGLSPMNGFWDKLLVSLEQSLEEINHIIPNLRLYINIAKKECN
jgi:hypothetical protein